MRYPAEFGRSTLDGTSVN